MALIESLHRGLDQVLARAPLRAWTERQARGAFVANRDRNLFHGVYETWDQAAAAARSFGQEGYDHPPSAALYDHRLRMDPHDYPSLYWLSPSLHEGMKVVFDVWGRNRDQVPRLP